MAKVKLMRKSSNILRKPRGPGWKKLYFCEQCPVCYDLNDDRLGENVPKSYCPQCHSLMTIGYGKAGDPTKDSLPPKVVYHV